VRTYDAALERSPGHPDLLWRQARVLVCMAEDTSDEARVPLLTRAEELARRCITGDPDIAEGHTWLAAALGYRALHAGPAEQVRLTNEIERETARALTLAPDDDAALSIRGSMYRALGNAGWFAREMAGLLYGGLPPGGYPEAEEALLKAIALNPAVMRHHYELGVLYLDQDRIAEAETALRRAADLPVRVAIDRPRQAKIRVLLSSIAAESGR